MKALTLKDYGGDENFATLVEQGFKKIETRKCKTNYRGDILICCSKSSIADYDIDTRKTIKSPNAGLALCVVKLLDIVPMTEDHVDCACCDLYDGAYAWILEDLRLLSRKFPVKGALRLFDVDIPNDVTY